MKLLVRLLAFLLLAPILAIAAVAVTARFMDGPLAAFPGGALEAGELVTAPVPDWSFASDVDVIELQLLEPARSRTTWIVAKDGVAYVPCGFLGVPLLKRWPYEAAEDGRALVRVEGRRYPVRLVKVEEAAEFEAVGQLVADKYTGGDGVSDRSSLWIFRLESR